MIAFSFMLFVGSLAAANNVEHPIQKVAAVESKNQTKEKISKSEGDPCTVCYEFSNGRTCSTGATCAEAETAVRITLGLE